MLNISHTHIGKAFEKTNFSALKHVNSLTSGKVFLRLLMVVFGIIFVFMLLPWTQNIRAEGDVTTLKPNQRPHSDSIHYWG